MRVSDMLAESVTLDVKGATVVYNPQLLTVADFEAMESVDPDNPDASVWPKVIDLLARVLVGWDLEDEVGPVPVTPEGIRRLPMMVIDQIAAAIQDHAQPSRAEGEDSSGASETPASDSSKPESQNGTDSSRQPDTSASLLGNLPVSPSAG